MWPTVPRRLFFAAPQRIAIISSPNYYQKRSDEDDERANALMDEEDEIRVVDTEGEDEEDGEREEEEQGEATEAMEEQSGDVRAQDTAAVGMGTEQETGENEKERRMKMARMTG
jgi:hypothetical protein